jgi:hypothetical protein
VGLNEINAKSPPDRGKTARAVPIESIGPTDNLDGKPFVAESVRTAAGFVEADKDKPITIAQSTGQVPGEDLGPAHIECVDELADYRPTVSHDNS